MVLVVALGALGLPRPAAGIGPGSLLDLAAIVYGGGNWQPRPTGLRRLAWEVRKRTSIETALEPGSLRLSSARLFDEPMLVLAGDRAFPPWSDADVTRLRRWIVYGGFLLVDDESEGGDDAGQAGGDFDESVRRELSRVLPGAALSPVGDDHVLYRTFYLLSGPAGRRAGPDHVLGIERDGRLAVLYARQDLAGAWARDNFGNWEHEVVPGGEAQRERAFRFGVNIAMYALCLAYKTDQVHVPFLLQRRAGRP